jgi:hypothetical protein
VKGHPVNQVGKLAQATAGTCAKIAVAQHHTFQVALAAGWSSYLPPEGKNFSWL